MENDSKLRFRFSNSDILPAKMEKYGVNCEIYSKNGSVRHKKVFFLHLFGKFELHSMIELKSRNSALLVYKDLPIYSI